MIAYLKRDWKTLVGFVLLATLALCVSAYFSNPTIFGVTLIILLLLRFLAGVYAGGRDIKKDYPPYEGKITCVIPFYNEDPIALSKCLNSILNNTLLPHRLVIVDDGSTSSDARNMASQYVNSFHAAGVKTELIVIKNQGKRHGLSLAWDDDADVYLCVDSDTILDEHAIDKVTRPHNDENVKATTGVVLAQNASKNLLTRLIDVRYASSMMAERLAYSAFGSVLCCCGSLAAYDGSVVRRNQSDFLTQKFLGKPAIFGDDRRITNYCLSRGRVVLVEDARAETLVPENFNHFIRQQMRWSKSFFRETLWVLRNFKWSHPAFLLSSVEMLTWVMMLFLLVFAVILAPILAANIALIGLFIIFTIIMSYARNVRYYRARDKGRWWISFACAPLYGLLHVFVLVPIRFYTLFHLTEGGWGTRKQVEVKG